MPKYAASGLGLVLVALLIAGCGSSGQNSKLTVASGVPVTKQCMAQPRRGGNLVYARQEELTTLDPYQIATNTDIFTDEMVYQGLVRNDPEGQTKVVPGLADSWTVSPDGKSYTFHLRPGVKFSNGTPVTSEDVRFSLENFGNPKVNTNLAVLATGYKNTEVINSSTVKVNLKQPVAAFLYNIAVFPAFIVPKAAVEKEGKSFWKHPVGAGPFKLKEFTPGSHVILERDPYYWESGKPYLNSVRFNFAVETNSRILALKNNQAQMADGIPYSQIATVQADPELDVQRVSVPANLWMSINHKTPQLADLDVRKAMAYVMNRTEMNEDILHGVGSIPNSILPHFALDASPSEVKPYEYNLAKAKEYMAKSKYPNGFSTTLQYPSGAEYLKQLTLLLQQEFAALGIKVKLVEVDQVTASQKFNNGEYELLFPYYQGSSDIPVPDEYAGFYALPSSETHGFFTYWSDPQIQKMVEQFVSSQSETSRKREWATIQQAFIEQEPILNILNTPYLFANSKTVCDPAVNVLGSNQLQLTWLAPQSGS
jgi:peptide/nickel transport system substrate-binding protein